MDTAQKPERQPDLNPSHELPVPHDMLLTKTHWGKIKKPKNHLKVLLLLLFLIPALFFAPLPSYQQQVLCKPGQTDCPREGWHIGLPFWERLIQMTGSDAESNQNTIQIPTVTVTPEVPFQEESWSVYTNEDYGISFEYPTSWVFYEDTAGKTPKQFSVDFRPKSVPDDYYMVSVIIGNFKSIDEHISTLYCTIGSCVERAVPAVLDNLPAKKVPVNEALQFQRVVAVKGSRSYEINIDLQAFRDRYPLEQRIAVFDRIVSTFSFADNTPAVSVTPAAICTKEAKLCPDGSFVGRTGPRCEFTPCPVDE